MIDDLSRRIRSKFEGLTAGADGAPGLDRGLGDVTTSSIEAYRLYAEAINFHERARSAEAAVMFEKAIAIDPAFAMAYAKLAVVENNLGHFDRRDKYAAQALKLTDRLTPRERFYIEGFFYSARRATLGRSIDAYTRCIEIDPGDQACRHNLGLAFLLLERHRESVEQYEELVRRGTTSATSFENLATARMGLGEVETGLAVAEAFLTRNPESALGHSRLAAVLVGLGRYDDAVREFDRARLLEPFDADYDNGRVVALVLGEEWASANEAARTLHGGKDETRRWFGAHSMFALSLFRGHATEGLRWADRVASAYKTPGQRSSLGHQAAAFVLLATGQAASAVAATTKAVTDAIGTVGEPTSLVTHAWALSAAGRTKDAASTVTRLESLTNPLAAQRDAGTWRWLADWWRWRAETRPAQSSLCRTRKPRCPDEAPMLWSATHTC